MSCLPSIASAFARPFTFHEHLCQLVETVELAETAGDNVTRCAAIRQLIRNADAPEGARHRKHAMNALVSLLADGAITPADLAFVTDESMLRAAILASTPRLWRAGLPRHEDVQTLAFGHGMLPSEALSVRVPDPILAELTIRLSGMMLAA